MENVFIVNVVWILTILCVIGMLISGILSLKTLKKKYLISMWTFIVIMWILNIIMINVK